MSEFKCCKNPKLAGHKPSCRFHKSLIMVELKREKIDAEAVNALVREEMIDLLLTSYWDKAERAKSYLQRIGQHRFLFAVNPKNEGFFLVWDSADKPSVLNREVFKAIAAEANGAKLAARYHVYASIASYTGAGIEFYKIPEKVLEHIGFNPRSDAFNMVDKAKKILEGPSHEARMAYVENLVSKPSALAGAFASNNEKPAPHVIVEARAGTGKTTTIIEGLKKLKGLETWVKDPTPQQLAVWDAILDGPKPKSVCFVAFNKSIATELQSKVPAGCDAMTMHSLGYKAVTRAYGRQEPNSWVVTDYIGEILEKDVREIRATKPNLLGATENLVSLCKMNLVEPTEENLAELAGYYEVELNGDRDAVFDLVPKVLEKCKYPKGRITFDDMIWLPVIHHLSVTKYDLLLVDEAQDLNRCQQALAKMAGKRLILVGDPKQAIYGFAGADAKSMIRMEEELKATDPGCIHLPLTMTRRCGKAIVAEANKIVPDFEAFPSNPEGMISNMDFEEGNGRVHYIKSVSEGDFILCRVNAPLVSQCFRFLKEGRKATIQGRDVGKGLINTIKKLKPSDVVDLTSKLEDWYYGEVKKENAKKNPNESRLINLQDRYDCLGVFVEGAATVEEVIGRIEKIFVDDKKAPGIKLSSIHKSKGLEAGRVFLLMPKGAGCPHPMARSDWQVESEYNLLYVAITRAITQFIYVR
jgi:hypothetical protein